MCMNGKLPKKRYASRAEAKAAIKRNEKLEGCNPYRCKQCNFFHVGHYPTEPEARQGMREMHRHATHP